VEADANPSAKRGKARPYQGKVEVPREVLNEKARTSKRRFEWHLFQKRMRKKKCKRPRSLENTEGGRATARKRYRKTPKLVHAMQITRACGGVKEQRGRGLLGHMKSPRAEKPNVMMEKR